jgi:hypothetical protein
VVSFTPRPLYPQVKSPWHPLDRKRKFLPNNHDTRRHVEGMIQLNGFKTTTLDGGQWSASSSGSFNRLRKSPWYRWREDWVGSKLGLDVVAKRQLVNKISPSRTCFWILHRIQEIPRLLRSLKVHYRAHKNPPLVLVRAFLQVLTLTMFFTPILIISSQLQESGYLSHYTDQATGWTEVRFPSEDNDGIFSFATASRPALELIQPLSNG